MLRRQPEPPPTFVRFARYVDILEDSSVTEIVTLSDHDARLVRLVRIAADDAALLLGGLIASASDVQFERALSVRGDDDNIRSSGGVDDSTADIATDPARLHLRSVLKRAEPELVKAATSLRGVRRALELALAKWDGLPPAE